MTLFEIEILAHHFISPAPFPRYHASGYMPIIRKFQALDLIEGLGADPESGRLSFEVTERGRAYIRALQAVPLPQSRKVWEIPGFAEMLREQRQTGD